MKLPKKIKTFSDRYPFLGPTIWMLSIQYYLIQLQAALAWPTAYSVLNNTISDLGNTACGGYGSRFVCSPLHSLMNYSFITLGLTMATGSLLIYQEFKKSRTSLVGFSFMAIAGFGTILVGLFPENTISRLHTFGAALPFLIGNIALVVLGITLDIPQGLRRYTLLSGWVALGAFGLFVTHNYVGLGIGGMERLVAYPQTIWLITFGAYISRNHLRSRRLRLPS